MSDTDCRCPNVPWYSPGSFGSGSTDEAARVERWRAEHGGHPYAKARDELAAALQRAEGKVGSGEAVLDMVHDVLGLPRNAPKPRKTMYVKTDGGIGDLAKLHGIDLVVVPESGEDAKI